MERILDKFNAEVASPTDLGTTTPRSKKGH